MRRCKESIRNIGYYEEAISRFSYGFAVLLEKSRCSEDLKMRRWKFVDCLVERDDSDVPPKAPQRDELDSWLICDEH